MMLVVKRDMTVVDGNHRLAAAINNCPDIRKFLLNVVIENDDGKRVLGVIYFNKELNKLAVRDKDATA